MTATDPIWVVRAGRGAAFVEEFISDGFVALGWAEVGPIDKDQSDEAIDALFEKHLPEEKPGSWQASRRAGS